MKRWLSALTFLAVLSSSVHAAGLIVVDEAHWHPPIRPPVEPPAWPRPRPWPIPRPHTFAPLEVTRHQTEVRIRDQVAATTIEQEFHNPNAQRLEGTFLFPVPKGAQIRKFAMTINGKPVEAELLAADRARGIYEDIVRKLKDPALLEYDGRDVYTVRIFPIEPNERKRVVLSYTQLLKADDGLVDYTYPLSVEKFSAKPIPSLSLKVEVETTRPLKSIYSPSHTVEINRRGARQATVGFEAKDVRPDADFHLYFAAEADEVGVNLMTYRTGADDGYFLLLLAPGIDAADRKTVPKDVVFVLDTSGSMAGQKLEQAKKALAFCVENLNDTDRFDILRFATEIDPLFHRLNEASAENRRRAQEFVQALKPIGGTAINAALTQALALRPGSGDRPFVVIFLTDGQPTIGETSEERILANVLKTNSGGTRVFCFGIGHDVNTHLLDQITEQTRSFSQYVLPEEDLEVKVSTFYTRIKDPVLMSPGLTFTSGVRVSHLHPSALPDVFKGEQLVVVGRYSGSGASAAVLEGKTDGATRKFTYDVSFPAEATEHDFIPRLWATRRVGYLLDEIRLHGEQNELREEIVELARRYGIVTPYTAYLIVEDEKQRGVPVTMQTQSPLQQDSEAREEVSAHYSKLLRERYGIRAVSGARSDLALRSANAPASAIANGNVEAQRGLAPAPATGAGFGSVGQPSVSAAVAPSASRVALQTQQGQFVGGRTFYQNGEQWIDSQIQSLKDPRRLRLQVGSKEYFDLLRREPQVRAWLALGTQVQFALNGTVYEVYE